MDKQEDIMSNQVILTAMVEQLKNPARAIVNSEAGFVKDRIAQVDPALASDYWNWVCCGMSRNRFSEEIYELQLQLNAIDKTSTMPAWGTYGT